MAVKKVTKDKAQKNILQKNDDDTVLHVGNFIFNCWELTRMYISYVNHVRGGGIKTCLSRNH
jgi:hypothetical protein